MKRFKRMMAFAMAVAMCISLCTSVSYAKGVNPTDEGYVDEEIMSDEAEEDTSEDSEEKDNSGQESDSIEEENVDSEEFSEKDSVEESEQEETSIPNEAFVLDESEDMKATGDVLINSTNFPDDIFRDYISTNFDKDGDNIIRSTEINSITSIDCWEKNITDLKGIENFPALSFLSCSYNKLTNLDVSKNVDLTYLLCNNNQLTSLDVSKNTKLLCLECEYNKISILKVDNNINLKELDCSKNQIEELDVRKNTLLEELYCSFNNLSELDVSNNLRLIKLGVSDNDITQLKTNNNKSLKSLNCSWNKLTELDVSENKSLDYLRCGWNSYNHLDISNNAALTFLDCDGGWFTSLDVSKNLELEILYCSRNHLDQLDISNNLKLRHLETYYNDRLKSIDISHNRYLVDAYRKGNQYNASYGLIYQYKPNPNNYIEYELIIDSTTSIDYSLDVTTVFDDIPSTAWYRNAVQYVYDNGIMAGKGASFKPNDNITREEFTQVLYSIEGKPAITTENTYTDVKNSWYTNSVLWAKENGIASGKPDGTFGVGKSITRQDMTTMLYSYAKLKGFDVTKDDNAINGYKDTESVQKYAKEAMNWAVTHGIISGKGAKGASKAETRLDPVGKASRAECAAMLRTLIESNKQ
ncbi:MAG: S-layer homology domain-containing protein [Lachnospiraceae bacterium]|nr:S-layer homology domain-containing protein [Lachnospiraceae bacterium]